MDDWLANMLPSLSQKERKEETTRKDARKAPKPPYCSPAAATQYRETAAPREIAF
jgi:hypothetical protein